jgi:hypothetical protein
MNPKEKLPLEYNNLNAINYRPETVNAEEEDKQITSKEAGNEVRNAIKNFEESLAKHQNYQ